MECAFSVAGSSIQTGDEIVRKRKTIKPVYAKESLFSRPWWYCGKCGVSRHSRLAITDLYCPQCGRRIEWEDEHQEADLHRDPEERAIPCGKDPVLHGSAVEQHTL